MSLSERCSLLTLAYHSIGEVKGETMNLENEAALVGLTLMSNLKEYKINNRFYKFNSCGHIQQIAIYSVRVGKQSRCNICFDAEIETRANLIGLTLINKISNVSGKRWFKFTDCQHEIETYTGAYKIKCQECAEEQLKKEALDIGYSIIDKGNKGGYRIYKAPCGHTALLSARYIRNKQVKCWQCMEDGYDNRAKDVGATRVASNETCKPNERTLLLRCGCTKNIRVDVLMLGYITCPVHNEYYYNQPSSVYLVKITREDLSWLKLGYAKVVDKRVKNYGLDDTCSIEIIKVLTVNTGKRAFEIERSIHSVFNSKRLDPEIMKSYHEKSGFTECYPIDMLDDLSEVMTSIGTIKKETKE